MDVALAAAGIFVTLLVVVGMVLIVPRGAERVIQTPSNLSLSPDEPVAPPSGVEEGSARDAPAVPTPS